MAAKATSSLRVSHDRLRRPSALSTLSFERSDELEPGARYLGQQRAVDALRFGLRVAKDGYNIFVLGRGGSSRHRIAQELARENAAQSEVPGDWCYVHNFEDPERPRTLYFNAGDGRQFRDDMQNLIEELQMAIRAAFEGDDYRNHLKIIEKDTQAEMQKQLRSLEAHAAEENIGVLQTPTGYVLAPIRSGEVVDEEDFAKLPSAEREKIEAAIQRLGVELQAHIEKLPKLRKKHRERVKALNRKITEHAVGISLNEIKEKYRALEDVVSYLNAVQHDVIENAHDFLEKPPSPLPFLNRDPAQSFERYEINLVVSNDRNQPAPVLFEANPTYPNIIGKVEHRAEMGALVTDFRMVRAGALLQANGGCLILDAQRLLSRPYVWEALKQALLGKSVRIESPAETYGFASTTTLQPEPIPLNVKIVLLGERWLYYLLCAHDSEFSELFKVPADFDDDLERTDKHVEAYTLLIADRIRELELPPFSRAAVESVIDQRARAAEDNERLSMHMRSLDDLLTQAAYWAKERDAELVGSDDIRQAVEARRSRLNRVENKAAEAILRETLLIDTDGSCVGQINGLSVIELGEHRFGRPMRITATTRIGSGNVVDIEREAELGGAIHSKGMMILSAALSSRYARNVPLSVHGSVVFEQSYGGVDGDSASVAELSALLSSLADIPLKQSIAVTGSINQLGRVQVVGGINEKIEGFFDICKSRGLNGNHGVIIPLENVKHLMLREDVVAAVEDDLFTIYGVQHIDEAIAILTGTEAGERGEDGQFPDHTVNGKVEEQLLSYARLRRAFAEGDKRGKADDER